MRTSVLVDAAWSFPHKGFIDGSRDQGETRQGRLVVVEGLETVLPGLVQGHLGVQEVHDGQEAVPVAVGNDPEVLLGLRDGVFSGPDPAPGAFRLEEGLPRLDPDAVLHLPQQGTDVG